MIPKVFLDTNVILDLIQERPGFEEAAMILQAGEDGKVRLCCSYLTMANIAFILRKTAPKSRLVPTLMQLNALIDVLPMDRKQMSDAFFLDGPDFEDILQVVCASRGHCDCIVTRNSRDYSISSPMADKSLPIPRVLTPECLLKEL